MVVDKVVKQIHVHAGQKASFAVPYAAIAKGQIVQIYLLKLLKMILKKTLRMNKKKLNIIMILIQTKLAVVQIILKVIRPLITSASQNQIFLITA